MNKTCCVNLNTNTHVIWICTADGMLHASAIQLRHVLCAYNRNKLLCVTLQYRHIVWVSNTTHVLYASIIQTHVLCESSIQIHVLGMHTDVVDTPVPQITSVAQFSTHTCCMNLQCQQTHCKTVTRTGMFYVSIMQIHVLWIASKTNIFYELLAKIRHVVLFYNIIVF
jgi:hypothetical protein